MSHVVICTICQAKFDRDKEAYTKTGARRYAHASCALRQCEENPKLPKPEIIDPTDIVNCIYCKKTFNKKEESFKLFSNGKYAHLKCFELEEKRELTDQEKLERYVMKLFNMDYVTPRVQKQIKDYVNNYGYSYSGIHKALIYYYEVKGNKFDKVKAQNGIGIVPHIYEKAFNYYYSIWEAQQKQEYIVDASSLEKYIPKTIKIHVSAPKREIKKRRLFTFLDEEE